MKATEAQIAENNCVHEKIQSAIVSCQEMAKLSDRIKVSDVIRKKVEELKKKL